MRIKVITLFPEMFASPLESSLIGKALQRGLLDIEFVNLRDYAFDKHKQVDDTPFGGGAGMVIKADVVLRAIKDQVEGNSPRVIYMSPGGRQLDQSLVRELAEEQDIVILCGHYEGIDERIKTAIHDEMSIGEYVLTGGELPALVLIDAVARLVPGVLGSEESVVDESFSDGLLEYPQYTRPREVEGMEVPAVLLSGNHEEIRRWRKKESLKKTLQTRPDLLMKKPLDKEEKKFLWDILINNEGND